MVLLNINAPIFIAVKERNDDIRIHKGEQ
jgi:hypothetical protein